MSARDVFRVLRTPVTLAVLLVVLGYGAWWGYKSVLTVPVSTANACVSQTLSQLLPTQVTVRVLNGGDTKGLASEVAKNLKARGYKVATIGNTDEVITTPVIIGATIDSPAVKLVATNFPQATVRADNRNDGTVDVLIGQNNASLMPATGYSSALPLPGGSACLTKTTPTPSPSASPTVAKT